MHCRTCGNDLVENAVVCTNCGCAPKTGTKFCNSCGAESNAEQVMCVKCGVALKGVQGQSSGGGGEIAASDPPKDPTVMCLLSVLLVGLGQILLGQTAKGIVLLVGTMAFVFVTCGYGILLVPFVWLVSGLDAYKIAKKLQDGNTVGAWEFF